MLFQLRTRSWEKLFPLPDKILFDSYYHKIPERGFYDIIKAMKKLFIFSIILAFTPLFVYAHGGKYLEFNPDATSSLKVSEVETPTQTFFAQNDFLGGFDIWVANPGSSGTATFALLNEQGSVISTKTVSIATIAEIANGTKLHVDFSSQLAVLSSSKYSIRITISMPELRLYYSDRIKVISHNAPFVSEYITGVGKLGSEEQTFSFKYALYETTESSAPIISNILWTVISTDEMEINFNANEPIDYRIEYGLSGQGYSQSTSFLGDYRFCTPGIFNCNINIPVSPNTTYQYRLTVKDSWGNQSQATGIFESGVAQTPAPTATPVVTASPTPTPSVTPVSSGTITPTPLSDITPPIISNLRVVEVTNNSVDIAWTTNEAANSYLGIAQGDYLITAKSDAMFELEHLLRTGLTLSINAPYLARVNSYDLANNLAGASISFRTLGVVPTPVPTLLGSTPTPQQPSPTVSVTNNPSGAGAGIVQWGTPPSGEPSDGYRIDVFNKDGSLNKTVYVPQGSHNIQVPSLNDGEYTVIVYSNNDGVFEKVDKPAVLKVGAEGTFVSRLLKLWPYFVLVGGLIAGFMIWRMLKKKPSQVPKIPVT